MSFDGFCGPMEGKPNHGIPQGSPCSPILAELFAATALSCLSPDDASIKAYVDDHLVEVSIFPGISLVFISLVMCSNYVMLALC